MPVVVPSRYHACAGGGSGYLGSDWGSARCLSENWHGACLGDKLGRMGLTSLVVWDKACHKKASDVPNWGTGE